MNTSPRLFLLFTCLIVSSLIGCNSGYRIDVDQGNITTPQQISRLQLGMTRDEVRFVLGTPLLRDPFHADRWDYYYSFATGDNKVASQERLSLFFVDDTLVKILKNGNKVSE